MPLQGAHNKDYEILRAVADAYGTLTELVDDNGTSIARLPQAAVWLE